MGCDSDRFSLTWGAGSRLLSVIITAIKHLSILYLEPDTDVSTADEDAGTDSEDDGRRCRGDGDRIRMKKVKKNWNWSRLRLTQVREDLSIQLWGASPPETRPPVHPFIDHFILSSSPPPVTHTASVRTWINQVWSTSVYFIWQWMSETSLMILCWL